MRLTFEVSGAARRGVARMAQNEMKAMRAMPWRVRSTEGLGVNTVLLEDSEAQSSLSQLDGRWLAWRVPRRFWDLVLG